MDWKQGLTSASGTGSSGVDSATSSLIEQQWPKIQLLFQEKVGPAALAAAQNDQAMESLFKTVYSVLPFPVRMVVKEPVFVSFCLEHRTKLLPAAAAAEPIPDPQPTPAEADPAS